MYVVTITERTPMPAGRRDTNTYHVFCDSLVDASQHIANLEFNFAVIVSLTITPFKE